MGRRQRHTDLRHTNSTNNKRAHPREPLLEHLGRCLMAFAAPYAPIWRGLVPQWDVPDGEVARHCPSAGVGWTPHCCGRNPPHVATPEEPARCGVVASTQPLPIVAPNERPGEQPRK